MMVLFIKPNAFSKSMQIQYKVLRNPTFCFNMTFKVGNEIYIVVVLAKSGLFSPRLCRVLDTDEDDFGENFSS